MPDEQGLPTPEETAEWKGAVEIVRAKHPDWSDEYIAGAIAAAVMSPEVQQAIEEIAAQHSIDVANWTAVIDDLMVHFGPGTSYGWSEQDCNTNLINLLRWVASQQPSAPEQRIADRPRVGPR